MKLRVKILAGLMLIIVLMGILSIVTFFNFNEVNQQFEFLIEHDLEVLQNAQKLQKLVVDAETGQRGFIIVGEEPFLEPYYSGVAEFNELVKIEKKLVSDNPPQVKKLEKIEKIFLKWNNEAAIPQIELAREYHVKDLDFIKVEEKVKTGTGKLILDQIREEFKEFIFIENELKDQRFEKVEKIKDTVEFNILIFIVISVAVGIGIAISISQSINKALKLLIVGAERFGRGEFNPIPVKGNDEIIELSNSFNIMASDIQFSNKRLQEMQGAIDLSSIVSITDNEGVITHVNDNFCEASKYTSDELIGKTHKIIKSNYQSDEFWKEMWKAISSGQVWSERIKNKAKDGTLYWQNTTIVPLYDNKEKISQYISISTIITKEIKFEEELKTNIDQLENQGYQLEQKNLELEKTEILKEEFVAMISHELKTPLTPILMWAGALQDNQFMGELNEKQTKATKTILNCANELSELISDIFDSYKLDLKKIEFNEHEINLTELMKNAKEIAEKLIGKHGIKVKNTTNENITVYGDKKRIDQIFKNLITNAIDFVDEDSGKIEINASVKGENIEFMIKDNGIGIKKEFQEELFKKFYQIDTSATRKHGGSGLGLSICQGMVQGMNGKIWVESESGEGTAFYFTLPIVNKSEK